MSDMVARLDKHSVKLERILLFQGSALHAEAIEDVTNYDLEELSSMLGENFESEDDILEVFDEKYVGWLFAEAHTPYPEMTKRGTLLRRWGLTTYTLIAAKTMDDIIDKSCKWADEKRIVLEALVLAKGLKS
jgi:hypothetical protein